MDNPTTVNISVDMFWLGFFIWFSVMIWIDYDDYRHGADSWLFKSTTEIEMLNEEIRLLEARKKKAELESELENKSEPRSNHQTTLD